MGRSHDYYCAVCGMREFDLRLVCEEVFHTLMLLGRNDVQEILEAVFSEGQADG